MKYQIIYPVTNKGPVSVKDVYKPVVSPTNSNPIVTFTAIAGQTDYTVIDVPDLSSIVGKTLKFVSDDSTVLPPANRSWDNVTFKIIGVDVAGGEDIVIFAK